MKTRLIVTLSLLIAVFLCGCGGPSQAQQEATVTAVAGAVYAQQTAEAPTITPTSTTSPTASPTNTPTLTPEPTATPTNTPQPTATATSTSTRTSTPQPTATSRPTRTPTLVPTPRARLSPYGLTPNDLPAGFVEVPPDRLAGLVQQGEDSHAFMLTDPKRSQIVMGILVRCSTRAEQLSFDARLPYFVQITAVGTGATEFNKLEGLDDIGEARSAMTTHVQASSVSYRVDIVGYRRGEMGALLIVMYPDGDQPATPVGDLARLLEKRISQFPNLQITILHRS